MDFYERLVSQTEADQAKLRSAPIITAALSGNVTRSLYLEFLCQAFHHVRHTVPLLMACGSRLPANMEFLRESVTHYIEEEIGHDEWILNDIRAIGGDADAVRQSAPAIETEVMVAYAYDLIFRQNPVGFFGMVFVLEGTSVELATRVAQSLGQHLNLPPSAFSYLSSHGSLDKQHIQDFRQLVNRLEKTEDQAAVIHAAKVFFRLYGDVIRSIGKEYVA